MPTPTLTDLLNTPTGFTWKGKTFAVSDATFLHRAEFCRWLKDRAIAAAGTAPEGAPAEFMAPFRQAVLQDIAAGVYDWASPACVKAMATRAGGVKALHLVVGASDPEFTEPDAEELWDGEFGRIVRELTARAVEDPPA